MSNALDWNEVIEQMEPIATDYLNTVKNTFTEEYDVSEIGERDLQGGIVWDITITQDEEMIVISFEVVDSLEYEGEMLGHNVSLKAVSEDGRIIAEHTPKNYTEDVWTTDMNELKERANNLPRITPDKLE